MTSNPEQDPRDKFHGRPGTIYQHGDVVIIIGKVLTGRTGTVFAVSKSAATVSVKLSTGNIAPMREDEIEHKEVFDFHLLRGDAFEVYGIAEKDFRASSK